MANAEFNTQQQVFSEVMILSLVSEINDAINSLIELASAWTDCDFGEALQQVKQSVERLETTKSELQRWGAHQSQQDYLNQIEEVQALLVSFEPFLTQKLRQAPESA